MQNDADGRLKSDWRRRLGRFLIEERILRDQPLLVLLALQRCIVVRCEYMYALRVLDYMAISPDFHEVPPGVMVPEYLIVSNGCSVEFHLRKEEE